MCEKHGKGAFDQSLKFAAPKSKLKYTTWAFKRFNGMGTFVVFIWARSDEDKKHEHEALLVAFLVVSIDLFWVFFMSFLYNGVYHRPHPSPLSHFQFQALRYSFIYSYTMFLYVFAQKCF